MPSRSYHDQAFSLVELLTVMAIVTVLLGVTVQSIGAISGDKLTTAAVELRNTAEQARQTATASGYPTELRIYEPQGSPGYYTAFQIVELNGTTSQSLNLMLLPQGVVISSSTSGSSMLTAAPTTNAAPAGYISANTRCIRFAPLGGIQGLTSTNPQTLTVVMASAAVTSNGLPNNYATVSFDPVLGSTAIYRP